MPSGREVNRLKSENRSLRVQVEELEGRPAALERQLQELRERLAQERVTCAVWVESAMAEREVSLSLKAQIEELTETLTLRYEDWTASQAAEMGRREGALRAERQRFTSQVEELLEDVDNTEARLKALLAKIEERGRRKEVEGVRAHMNRAMLGCVKSRAVIEEKLAELKARQPQETKVFVVDDRHLNHMVQSHNGSKMEAGWTEQREPRVVILSRTHDQDCAGQLVGGTDFEPTILPMEDDLVTYRSENGGPYRQVQPRQEPHLLIEHADGAEERIYNSGYIHGVKVNQMILDECESYVRRDLAVIDEHARWLDDGGRDLGGES